MEEFVSLQIQTKEKLPDRFFSDLMQLITKYAKNPDYRVWWDGADEKAEEIKQYCHLCSLASKAGLIDYQCALCGKNYPRE
jgi:hypothetical protein